MKLMIKQPYTEPNFGRSKYKDTFRGQRKGGYGCEEWFSKSFYFEKMTPE